MHRNAALISVTCILLCFTFNYTFPLQRGSTKWNLDTFSNLSGICDKSEKHVKKLERTKKMSSNLGDTLKRFKDSTQDFKRNIQSRLNSIKNPFSEEELRQYEQLVIMKKNPYIDLKDIEQKFSPKNTRQSQFDNGPSLQNSIGDPGIWESVEEGANVEIINRGLTGFAIPAKIVKNTQLVLNKSKLNTYKTSEDSQIKQNTKMSKTDDISNYRDDKICKT